MLLDILLCRGKMIANTPEEQNLGVKKVAPIKGYRWVRQCNGLFDLPLAEEVLVSIEQDIYV